MDNNKARKGSITFTFGEFPKLLGGEDPGSGDGVIAHHPVVRVVGQPLEVQGVILLPLCLTDVTSGIDVVSEEEVKLPDGDVDVVRIDTETRMKTVRRLLQSLPVCTLQRNSFEQYNLD